MSAFFLGLGFYTLTLEFWVPLEKAQVFADGCKDLFEKGKTTRREIAAVVGRNELAYASQRAGVCIRLEKNSRQISADEQQTRTCAIF